VRQGEIGLGDEVYLIVPSGNFGNALGAYYAKKAGLPIRRILIASNANNILTEWIETGVYDIRDRELILTESPAMDILKSSNIERVLFDKFGAEQTRAWMEALNEEGIFRLDEAQLRMLQEDFAAVYSTDEEGAGGHRPLCRRGIPHGPPTAPASRRSISFGMITAVPAIIYSTVSGPSSAHRGHAIGLEAEGDREALGTAGFGGKNGVSRGPPKVILRRFFTKPDRSTPTFV